MIVKIELDNDEVFQAIAEYINKQYPLNSITVQINVKNNLILGATVDCTWRDKE